MRLDLSSPFDTIDYMILLDRLSEIELLQWCPSFLQPRKQIVMIDGVISKSVELGAGVPQGFILGSLFFAIYILPLSRVLNSHGVK